MKPTRSEIARHFLPWDVMNLVLTVAVIVLAFCV